VSAQAVRPAAHLGGYLYALLFLQPSFHSAVAKERYQRLGDPDGIHFDPFIDGKDGVRCPVAKNEQTLGSVVI